MIKAPRQVYSVDNRSPPSWPFPIQPIPPYYTKCIADTIFLHYNAHLLIRFWDSSFAQQYRTATATLTSPSTANRVCLEICPSYHPSTDSTLKYRPRRLYRPTLPLRQSFLSYPTLVDRELFPGSYRHAIQTFFVCPGSRSLPRRHSRTHRSLGRSHVWLGGRPKPKQRRDSTRQHGLQRLVVTWPGCQKQAAQGREIYGTAFRRSVPWIYLVQ